MRLDYRTILEQRQNERFNAALNDDVDTMAEMYHERAVIVQNGNLSAFGRSGICGGGQEI